MDPRLLHYYNLELQHLREMGAEFAQQFPTSIFLELMGLPVEELPQFMEWEHAILHASDDDLAAREAAQVAAMQAVMGRFYTTITERRAEPKDDIVSVEVQNVEGETLLRAHV